MAGDVYVAVEHLAGKVAEVSFEMLGKGKELAEGLGGKLCAVVLGKEVREIAEACGVADTVFYIENEVLAHFTPEAYAKALATLLKEKEPQITLVSNTSMGMDIAPDVALSLNVPIATNVSGIRIHDGKVLVTSQIYGGKVWAEAEVEGSRCLISVLTGAFPAEKGKTEKAAAVEQIPAGTDLSTTRIVFKRLIEPEAADVDITKEEVLVSVGRGIQDKENISLVQALADTIGCPLSASRPVVDMGWLPKSRQVGKSGVTVKPKIYIAVGISGAPEHIQGMKDAATIIAINSDPKAPIFDVAHYGVVGDLFDIVPALAEKLQGMKG